MTQQIETELQGRWVPGFPERDLPGPGASPLALRLFGEELIAFRQRDGAIGVIGGYCPHEGAPLHDGRIHQGARCSLHGWEFDASGRRCDPYPVSRGDGVSAYKSRPRGGLVWVFFGSGEPAEWEPAAQGAGSPWHMRAFPAGIAMVSAAVRAIGGARAEHDWSVAFTLPVDGDRPEACTLLLVPKDAGRTSVVCGPICLDEDMVAISRALASA